MSALLQLAERCEKATGPDIGAELTLVHLEDEVKRAVWDLFHLPPRPFLHSIDAAMTLVPEGWALTLLETTDGDRRDHTGDPLANWQAALIEHKNTGYRVDQRGCWRQGLAATAALALTAAALRARGEPGQ